MIEERLIVENFLGIKKVELNINRVNILIGPQASGKSVTIKLVYFFREIFNIYYRVLMEKGSKRDINSYIKDRFIKYFSETSWHDTIFRLSYMLAGHEFKVEKEKNSGKTIKIIIPSNLDIVFNKFKKKLKDIIENKEYSLSVKVLIEFQKDYYNELQNIFGGSISTQIFIPAGRSFFSTLKSNIFSLISESNDIDPFLVEFGSFYENIKLVYNNRVDEGSERISGIDKVIFDVLKAKYVRDKNGEFLELKNGIKISLTYCSSGQQEALPLTLVLRNLYRMGFPEGKYTCYIEEPEAHLFPNAQKDIVNIISLLYNKSKNPAQFFITTHSPYILTALNNNMYAGFLTEGKTTLHSKKIDKIISEDFRVKPNDVSAYLIDNGKAEDLIDGELKIITAEKLDLVSNELAATFDELLELSE